MMRISTYTVRDALRLHGWQEDYLSPDLRFARFGIRWGEGFLPFRRGDRWAHPFAFIRLRTLVDVRDEICFSERLRSDPGFPGLIEPVADNEFPYEVFLPVVSLRLTETVVAGGPLRWVSNIAFTFVNDVSIRTARY